MTYIGPNRTEYFARQPYTLATGDKITIVKRHPSVIAVRPVGNWMIFYVSPSEVARKSSAAQIALPVL